MLRIIFNLVLIIIFLSLEESGLAANFFLNPYLCLVVFFAVSRDKFNIIWPILGGAVLDYFSIFKFPIFIISLIITFLIIRLITERIMTFRSFVSLAIISCSGILTYNLIFLIINGLTHLFNLENIALSFNGDYLLHLIFNIIFTFFLLLIFKKKYDRSVLFDNRK